MKQDHLVRRYIVFLMGLMVISFGIAAITKASLGTSPITSIPYSLSLIFPTLTLGNWTILFSLLLIALQGLILGSNADKFILALQVVISFVFGYFIDFGMMCLSWFSPTAYLEQILSVVIGCCGLAFGVYLQIIANVVMVPGDGFVYALTRRLRKEYGKVRVASDSSMIVIAAVISLVALGTLGGVREGTVICAILTGNIARLYFSKLSGLTKILIPESASGCETASSAEERHIDDDTRAHSNRRGIPPYDQEAQGDREEGHQQ